MKRWFVLLMIALCMSVASAGGAQIATGNIYGTVSDQQGAVLPGVNVSIVAGFFFNGAKEKFGRSPGYVGNEPASFQWNQGNFYPETGVLHPLHGLWKVEDNHTFGTNLLVNAKYAWYGWGYGFDPIGGSANNGCVEGERCVHGGRQGASAAAPGESGSEKAPSVNPGPR